MTFSRCGLALLALAAALQTGAGAAAAATVAHYRFENGTAATPAIGRGTILDSSGNGLDGTPHHRPWYQAVDNPDSAIGLRFDGNSRVNVPDAPLFELTHGLTLEAYVFVKDNHDIIAGLVGRGDDRYGFDPYYVAVNFLRGGVLEFVVETEDTASALWSPSKVPLRQWIHVAATLDDATGVQSLYINGALVASKTTTVRPFAKLQKDQHPGLRIGGSSRSSPDRALFHGSMDEIRISDVALDPSQFLPPP